MLTTTTLLLAGLPFLVLATSNSNDYIVPSKKIQGWGDSIEISFFAEKNCKPDGTTTQSLACQSSLTTLLKPQESKVQRVTFACISGNFLSYYIPQSAKHKEPLKVISVKEGSDECLANPQSPSSNLKSFKDGSKALLPGCHSITDLYYGSYNSPKVDSFQCFQSIPSGLKAQKNVDDIWSPGFLFGATANKTPAKQKPSPPPESRSLEDDEELDGKSQKRESRHEDYTPASGVESKDEDGMKSSMVFKKRSVDKEPLENILLNEAAPQKQQLSIRDNDMKKKKKSGSVDPWTPACMLSCSSGPPIGHHK